MHWAGPRGQYIVTTNDDTAGQLWPAGQSLTPYVQYQSVRGVLVTRPERFTETAACVAQPVAWLSRNRPCAADAAREKVH